MYQDYGWKCPYCGLEHQSGDCPDYWTNLGDGDVFEFDCDCGHQFKIRICLSIAFETIKDRNPLPAAKTGDRATPQNGEPDDVQDV